MDYLIFQKLNQFAGKSGFIDSLAVFFAEYLGYVLIFVLLLLLFKNSKKYLAVVAQSLTAAVLARFVITDLIRFFWYRPRPFVENNVNLLFSHSPASSFPSGHAAFFFALSTVVYLYNKKAGIMFFIASFLISISRVFVGVHWPSDIIAGAIVGIASGILLNFLFRKFFSAGKKESQQ